MTPNKATIGKYIDGFNKSDHDQILSCLTDDIVWDMPGVFHLLGKKAFDGEIENPAFVGSPVIQITRLIEEDNVVAVEGTVQAQRKDGTSLDAAFCDVFVMHNGLIRHLTSYLNEVK